MRSGRVVPRGDLRDLAWDRWLLVFTVLGGLLALIVVLQHTEYPYPVRRLLVFQYLLREQDIVGGLFVIALAVAAYLPGTRSGVLHLAETLGRHPRMVAALTFVTLCASVFVVARNHPLAGDEFLALFQSRVFAAGQLTAEFPPDLLHRLIPTLYQWRWLIASETTGEVTSVYWPGFSLLLVPFTLIGAPWACNPLFASLSLLLMSKLARRISGDSDAAGGWALLFALGSPMFTGMALSYFSMTAHLFLNLLFAWLLLCGGRTGRLAAGVVGSLALVQSNPVPHALFALPWLVWTARQPQGRRKLLELGAGYAPLALLLGLGWWLFLRKLQGEVPVALFPPDSSLLHRLANLLWYLHLEFRNVFTMSWDETFAKRVAEQARLWTWTVPGLPLLALAGWWLRRRLAEANVLALSLVSTLLGYLLVSFDQGYGWGARYVHSAFGVLPVLAAGAMTSLPDAEFAGRLRAYSVRVALFSLIFATALRFSQIRLFMDDHLSIRPPFEAGVRQIVFVVQNYEHYTQDFLQNDPFLREPVIFMSSRGVSRDSTEVIRRRFPKARLTYDGPNGQVWRFD